MKIVSLEVDNFCCFKHFKINLDDLGLVCISGQNDDTTAATSNGSGKSTIFKALSWGLFGKTVDGERGDKVIKQGESEAVVSVIMGGDSGEWNVIRKRKKGAPSVSLIQPGGESLKLSKDEIQLRIEGLLGGLNFQAFKNSILYGQNDTARFSHPDTSDPDRKLIISKAMGTDIFAVCHDLIKDDRLAAHSKVQELQSSALSISSKIDSLEIDSLREKYDNHDEQKLKVAKELLYCAGQCKEKAVSVMSSVSSPTFSDEQLEEIKDKLKSTVDSRNSLSALIDSLELEHVKKRDDWNSALRDSEKQIERTTADLELTEESLFGLDGERCPKCKSKLKKGEAAEYVLELTRKREKLRVNLEKQEKYRGIVRSEKVVLDKGEKAIATKKSELQALVNRIDSMHDEIQRMQKEQGEYERKKASVVKEASLYLEKAKGFVRQRKVKLEEENPYGHLLEMAMGKRRRFKKELVKIDDRLGRLESKLAHIEYWVKGFSNQGLPSFMIDFAMPYITQRANEYLGILSDGDISICFSTQRELKSNKGEYRDQIDMAWSIEGIDDSYPPSGGQLKKIEISVDLALMDLVASKGAGDVGLLMMDEILDGLDLEGRNRVIKLLKQLRKSRGTILVVTHEPDLSEYFEKSINVKKVGGTSTLEMVQ